MGDAARLLQSLPGSAHVATFAQRAAHWLIEDLNASEEPVPDFTESRAKALLRASDLLDDPTRHSFERLMQNETAVRIALFDLLQESELEDSDEIAALVATTAASEIDRAPAVQWLSLAIAAYAWKSEYPLCQLDPASPPMAFSPAGQVLKRAAYFVRQQVQRSATERDKLGRRVAFNPEATGTATLDTLRAQETIAPLPPYYRSPVPVRYPEVARETLHLESDESEASGGDEQTAVTRGEPITITPDDLEQPQTRPVRQEPIQITREQTQPAAPPPQPAPNRRSGTVSTPSATTSSNFSAAIRKSFGRGREPMKTTKLRVVVQEHPDGPGVYGLQVRVTCKGIKSHVAGTTKRDGTFMCELPVPMHSGLTYDVDVTWPRDMDSEKERKSITLNADRTEFTLPFYHRLNP